MKEKVKSTRVSRRVFLKGLGGGAFSTAVISTGLLNSNPGEAYAAAPGKKNIHGDITSKDFETMRDHLLAILKDTGAAVVNMRLNETGRQDPAPVFVGWVEDETLRKRRRDRREPDPGFTRFGDTVAAKEYTETISAKGVIQDRDWRERLHEKSPEQKALVPRAGVMDQKLIGIIAQEGNVRRCVGTLNLGFRKRPDAQAVQKAEKVMRHWAQDQNSKLVTFLKTNFQLGGPTL